MRLNEIPKEASPDRKVIEADEIRVGPITITSGLGENSTAGIWIGNGRDRAMIAIFSTPTQVGIGIYAKGMKLQPCDVCLFVDKEGEGSIQFSDDKGGVALLSYDDVKKLIAKG